ncbi:MAG: GntR family transcriptional regulator [Lentisphaerae bacterium]|nr:MAG: GntR family transcriptional regulator [Lentisphaerota bacterium]
MNESITYDRLMRTAGTPGRREVVRRILGMIRNGQLPSQGTFPSERKLSDMLNLSRPSLRLALKALIELEILYKLPGSNRWYIEVPPSLLNPKPSTIALITSTHEQHLHMSREEIGGRYHLSLHQAVTGYLQNGSRHILTLLYRELDSVSADWLDQIGVNGLIVLNFNELKDDHSLILECHNRGIPVVVEGNDGWCRSFDRVYHDHEAGAKMLVHWLYERGCRKIMRVCWGSDEVYWRQMRHAGYLRALKELGLAPLPVVRIDMGRPEDLEADPSKRVQKLAEVLEPVLSEYLRGENAVDAIMADTDSHIYPIQCLARKLGRCPGEDIWFAGYDAFAPWAPEAQNRKDLLPHVSIDKQNELIGIGLCQLLEKRLSGFSGETQVMTTAPRLVSYLDV